MTPVQQILQFIGNKELSPLADYIRKEILPLEEKMLREAFEAGAKSAKENSFHKHYRIEVGWQKISADKTTFINNVLNPQK